MGAGATAVVVAVAAANALVAHHEKPKGMGDHPQAASLVAKAGASRAAVPLTALSYADLAVAGRSHQSLRRFVGLRSGSALTGHRALP